jgi:hypothetical protein
MPSSTWALVLAGTVIAPALSLHVLRATSSGPGGAKSAVSTVDAAERRGPRCPACGSTPARSAARAVATVMFCAACDRGWIVAGRSARPVGSAELVRC